MGGFKGFTLIELMVTVAIVGVAATVAVPSLTVFMQNNRMTTNVNDFVTSINVARSEAVKRGTKVTLCKSNNGKDCASSGNWEQGWISFVDPNNNAAVDKGETLLQVHETLRGKNTTLIGNSNVDDYISFAATGFSQQTSGALQPGTLILCDDRGFGKNAKGIVLNTTGRVMAVPATETGKVDCHANQ